jgi:hypothetical protein
VPEGNGANGDERQALSTFKSNLVGYARSASEDHGQQLIMLGRPNPVVEVCTQSCSSQEGVGCGACTQDTGRMGGPAAHVPVAITSLTVPPGDGARRSRWPRICRPWPAEGPGARRGAKRSRSRRGGDTSGSRPHVRAGGSGGPGAVKSGAKTPRDVREWRDQHAARRPGP